MSNKEFTMSVKRTGRKTQSQKTGAIIKSMEMEILSLRVQLTDANETIRQNRLTLERLQNKLNVSEQAVTRVIDNKESYQEIALNLSRHLAQTSQSFEDKYNDL